MKYVIHYRQLLEEYKVQEYMQKMYDDGYELVTSYWSGIHTQDKKPVSIFIWRLKDDL